MPEYTVISCCIKWRWSCNNVLSRCTSYMRTTYLYIMFSMRKLALGVNVWMFVGSRKRWTDWSIRGTRGLLETLPFSSQISQHHLRATNCKRSQNIDSFGEGNPGGQNEDTFQGTRFSMKWWYKSHPFVTMSFFTLRFFSRKQATSECDWVAMTSVFDVSQSNCFFLCSHEQICLIENKLYSHPHHITSKEFVPYVQSVSI